MWNQYLQGPTSRAVLGKYRLGASVTNNSLLEMPILGLLQKSQGVTQNYVLISPLGDSLAP